MPPMPKPAPKIPATKVPPPGGARDEEEEEERAIDQSVDESFPASDPPAIASPGSTAAVKEAQKDGRETPGADRVKEKRK